MARNNAPQATATETMTIAAVLARQVAFDTLSCEASSGPIDLSRAWLERYGVACRVGTNQGGAILTLVPARCAFTMEWRNTPADDFFAQVACLRGRLAG